MEARDSFGYWVRRRRKSLDLTQEELAQRVGCALVTLRKIEADERRPSLQMAERLAHGLALPPSEWAEFVAAALGEHSLAWLERTVSPPGARGNLPASVTSFVGREQEVAAIVAMFQHSEVRLLTLTGPVGVGKTRLAIEAGWRLMSTYEGVYLVELATVRAPELVLSAIATDLNIQEGREGILARQVEESLVGRSLVLILDNFEHLLSATAQVAALLAHCPSLRMLVTSRARLHLYGEHELTVPPLPIADEVTLAAAANSAAVRLFCERARASRVDFQLTSSLLPTVVEICRRLDGLPLAIELAAARIRLFSPQELLTRLEYRLPTPTDGDLLSRLRVLEKAVLWSYELLTPTQRTLALQLSVFIGGFDLAAAQAVCRIQGAESASVDFADAVIALLDQSLLTRQASALQFHLAGRSCLQCPLQQLHEDEEQESRFIMLETVRKVLLEQLRQYGEFDALHRRHADYFAMCAIQTAAQLHGPAQASALLWFERNRANLRAALTWLLDGRQVELAAQMGCALGVFWQRHGHYDEGRRWLDRIMAALQQQPTPATLRARILQTAAELAYRQGDCQRAQPWLAECAAIFAAAGDTSGQASVYFDLGWIAIHQGDWDEAVRLNQACLKLARIVGDPLLCYRAHTNLGWVHLCIGAYTDAAPLFEEARRLAQQMHHVRGIAVSLINLGWVEHYMGVPTRTMRLAQSGLRLCCRLGERELMAECVELLALATLECDKPHDAARLCGAADALRASLHISRPAMHHVAVVHDHAVAALQARLGAADFATDWQAGCSMSLEALLVDALGCECAGRAAVQEA